MDKTERNLKIVAAVAAGASMRAVAREHGITNARVKQIVTREAQRRADSAAVWATACPAGHAPAGEPCSKVGTFFCAARLMATVFS